jgi:hypothetical protein
MERLTIMVMKQLRGFEVLDDCRVESRVPRIGRVTRRLSETGQLTIDRAFAYWISKRNQFWLSATGVSSLAHEEIMRALVAL